jgi:hypothetical protein
MRAEESFHGPPSYQRAQVRFWADFIDAKVHHCNISFKKTMIYSFFFFIYIILKKTIC